MNRKYVFIIISLLCAFSLVLVGCGSDSGGGMASISGKAPGTLVISGAGGDATDEPGGQGGFIEIESNRDIIATTESSVVDTSFTVPAGPTYRDCTAIAETETPGDMGEEFRPAADVIVNAVDDITNGNPINLATAGEAFLVFDQGTQKLYVDSDNDRRAETSGEDQEIDCINIPAGVTVTLMLNNDYSGWDTSGADQAIIQLDGDIEVAGTLRTALMNTANGNNCGLVCESRGDLEIYAHQIFVAATGVIDTSGGDARFEDEDGGKGGDIDLWSNRNNGGYIEILGTLDSSGGDDIDTGNNNNNGGDASQIDLNSNGSIYVAGSIIAEGGDGEEIAGGEEANPIVDLDADTHIYFTGNISTVGGNATNDDGGSGGDVDIYSDYGSIFMAGSITTDGGNGGAAAGSTGHDAGNGGNIEIDTDEIGTVVISTVMSAVGGDATLDGHGGDGGDFGSYSYSGDFLFSGSFDGSGGKGNDTVWDSPGGTYGGDGGDFDVYVSYTSDYGYGEETDPGNIEIGGNITLAGGSSQGGNGGDGGFLYLGNDDYSDYVNPPGGSISLVGFANFDFKSGSSTYDDGGSSSNGSDNGYALDVETGSAETMYDAAFVAGSIYWGVPTDISGGNGSMGSGMSGGDGGRIWFETDGGNGTSDSYNRDSLDTVVVISAPINAFGGNADYAGDGGDAEIFGYNLVDISAQMDLSGGIGNTAGGQAANDWGDVDIFATERINMTALLDVSGGNGDVAGTGGDSSTIYIQSGIKTTVTGGIDASGGDAASNGGDSGQIDILSQIESSEVTLSNIDIARGTGSISNGAIGYLTIDWMNFSSTTDGL